MTQIKYNIPDYNIFKEWRPEQHFQRIDKYSNFLDDEGRLETWEEVVERTVDALRLISKDKLPDEEYQTIFDMIYKLEIMPSMRLLSMPLKAIERCNTVLYNCTYGLGDTFQSIAEAQYLSMSGCGVSWSVERKNVDKLPKVPQQTGMMYYHNVEDSQIGWAKSTEALFNAWIKGNDITFQYDRIRPYGARLKTKGGYASGPQILIDTHNFIRQTLKNAQGRKVTPLEMHDMFCYVLESGVSGGTRRCLAENTKVLTKNGEVNICDIAIGDIVDTPLGYKPVTNVFKQGEQFVTKITLENGAVVEATENHRLSTSNEWVYVKDIMLNTKLYYFNGHSVSYVKVIEIHKKWRSIETYDIEVEKAHCFFANGILSHNSAGMCIFDADNLEIAQCKYDGFWNDPIHKVRANANNSAVWGDDLTQKDVNELTEQLFSTGTAEPGLLKRSNAVKTSPEWRKFIHPESVSVNPCLVEGTMVQTKNGHFPIESLVGKEVEIWNGLEWTKIDNFRVTGEDQPVYTVTLHDGTEITATSYHTFILEDGERKELKDLVVGDKLQISNAPLSHGNKKINGAYLKGFLMGDGTSTSDDVLLNLYEPKFMCEERLIRSAEEIEPGEVKTNAIIDVSFGNVHQSKNSYRKLMKGINVRRHELYRYIIREFGLPQELFEADYESKCEFLAGLFDADGTASDTKNGFMYQYSSIHYQLLQDIQLLLKTIGINSTLRKNRESGVKDFNDNYGEYLTHDLYRLTISQISSVAFAKQVKFTRLISFEDKKVSYTLKPKWNKIVQIEQNGVAEKVYCCTVPETHQFSLTNSVQIAQCSEIFLQAIPIDSEYIKGGGWQFCNLSTINARNTDTIKDLYEKTKYATLIGDIQSLATDFQFLRSGTKEICDLERLLGVNLVGYATVPLLRGNPEIVQELRDLTVEVDLKFAEEFNVNRSAAITALKPSGNSSVFCYTAPGGNPIHAIKQIRNVTVNKNSAMHTFLEAQGVPRNDYPGRDYASMFAFPIEYPEDSVTLEHCNAIDQLNIWKYLKLNWCHHNPSVSITYEPHEVEAIRQWLYENQDIIGGLAFFPKYESSYELLPIVVVNEEKYAAFTKDYPKIPWEYYHLYETAHDDRQGVAECSSGNCLIV